MEKKFDYDKLTLINTFHSLIDKVNSLDKSIKVLQTKNWKLTIEVDELKDQVEALKERVKDLE